VTVLVAILVSSHALEKVAITELRVERFHGQMNYSVEEQVRAMLTL
jgi:hypothetical protein